VLQRKKGIDFLCGLGYKQIHYIKMGISGNSPESFAVGGEKRLEGLLGPNLTGIRGNVRQNRYEEVD